MNNYVKNLKVDQVIFGIGLFESAFEIYSTKAFEYGIGEGLTHIKLDNIISVTSYSSLWKLILPYYWDLDEPICVYYTGTSAWIYTTNEEKAVKLYSDLLTGNFKDTCFPGFDDYRRIIGICRTNVSNKRVQFFLPDEFKAS